MSTELIITLFAGLSTVAIMSFLVRENSVYRAFEHIFIGLSAGLGIVVTIRDFLYPRILMPMFGWDVVAFPDGTVRDPGQPMAWLYAFPLAFGLLYYTIFIPRYRWMSRLVIGFTLGAGGGLAIKGFFNEIIPQVTASFKPLVVFINGELAWLASFNNIVFVATLGCTMAYFFFTLRRGEAARGIAGVGGRWLMMVCFGAFFGSTVMARMAILVERLQFLLIDWKDAIFKAISHV
jgi:hypothetical protein